MATIYNNRTLTAGYEYDPTAIRLSGTWGNLLFSATLTNGVVPPFLGAQIGINYLWSSVDLGASPITKDLVVGSGRQGVICDGLAQAVTVRTAKAANPNSSTSNYLYVWLDHDNLNQPVNLTLTVDSIASNIVFDSGSNIRYTPGKGLQVFNTATGLWHTLLCVGNNPTLAFDNGQV